MSICKCKNSELFEMAFGLVVFVIILFVMHDKIILLFEQNEWYRALAVTLGGIIVAGSIGIVSSFSAVWIIDNIGKVLVIAGIFWAIGLLIV